MPKNPITSNGILTPPTEISCVSESRDFLKVTKSFYNGKERIDIRFWYVAADDETLLPGKRGISLSPESALDVAKAIQTILGRKK
jgi:hypothetical protein